MKTNIILLFGAAIIPGVKEAKRKSIEHGGGGD
jgi:hypothetical protein